MSRARDALRSRPALWRAARSARLAAGRIAGSRTVTGVTGRVHHNDLMLRSSAAADVAHYVSVGHVVVGLVDDVLGGTDWSAHAPVLDLGSGYGRLTRALLDRVAPADLAVSDTDRRSTAFCHDAFGVRVAGDHDGGFGLVLVLTVVTNLAPDAVEAVLTRVAGATRPDGVAVITTHGRSSVDRHLDRFGSEVANAAEQVRAAVDATGTAFVPSPGSARGWGTAWHTPAFVVDAMDRHGFDHVSTVESAIDDHQDALAFRRRA